MEQDIDITLRFRLARGETGLNEIAYRLKEMSDTLSNWGQRPFKDSKHSHK